MKGFNMKLRQKHYKKTKGGSRSKGGVTHQGKVMHCDCRHLFQDSLFGYEMRAHNPMGKEMYRCTVCSKEK